MISYTGPGPARATTMSEMGRISNGARRRACNTLRSSRYKTPGRKRGAKDLSYIPRWGTENVARPALPGRGLTTHISTRQCCRVEFAATHSKQSLGARATRQFSGGPLAQILQSQILNVLCRKRVSIKTRCFPAQVVQNKRSEPKTSVNFLRSVFRPTSELPNSTSGCY